MAEHRLRWSALPDPVAQRIVRQAFADGGCTVRDWVTLSLVCKCAFSWNEVLRRTRLRRQHACARQLRGRHGETGWAPTSRMLHVDPLPCAAVCDGSLIRLCEWPPAEYSTVKSFSIAHAGALPRAGYGGTTCGARPQMWSSRSRSRLRRSCGSIARGCELIIPVTQAQLVLPKNKVQLRRTRAHTP